MRSIFTCLIALLLAQPAAATTVQYYKLYVPVITIGADSDPELKIETALYRSYMDGREFKGALLPFYVNDLDASPTSRYNINPASMMRLKIDIQPRQDQCVLMLDVTEMTPPENKDMQYLIAEGEVTLADILEKAAEATKMNLAADTAAKRCNVVVTGLDSHPAVKATIKPNSPLFKAILKGGS